MANACRQSCNICPGAFDQHPPGQVRLWNGLLMPAVGFGTAGLGDRTTEAVQAALLAGVRMLDSAQAREWYREDLNGKVCYMHHCDS